MFQDNQPVDSDKEMELAENKLEQIMSQLNPKNSIKQRKMYLAGIIDCWADEEKISEETRGLLYEKYCF